jgi:type II secretory pathway predicted ATPase ExeA
MMYLQHFHLSEAPFGITPHTAFFYPGSERGAILDALIYAAQHEEGIVKVTGEVGSGKSMLCRKLMESLPQQIVSIYLANPSLGRDEILAAIAEDLVPGFSADGKRSSQLTRQLQSILVDLYAEGKRVLLLVDEAHAMPAESLEEIRLLSNLESNRHKLLHIVLFGQQELDELLTKHAMRPLQERITQRFWLKPLSATDIGQYLYFRLKSARYMGPELFSPEAIQLISAYSHGLARRVNILADKALLAAYTMGESRIEARHVKQAIADAGYKSEYLWSSRPRYFAIAASVLASLCAAVALFFFLKPGSIEILATAVAPNLSQNAETDKANTAQPELEPTTPQRSVDLQVVAVADRNKPVENAFARGTEWLADSTAPTYSIQLAVTSNDASHQAALGAWIEKMAPGSASNSLQHPVMLFKFKSDSVNVLYGQYESREAARAAYLNMPATIRPRDLQIRTKRGVLESMNAADGK